MTAELLLLAMMNGTKQQITVVHPWEDLVTATGYIQYKVIVSRYQMPTTEIEMAMGDSSLSVHIRMPRVITAPMTRLVMQGNGLTVSLKTAVIALFLEGNSILKKGSSKR